MNLADTITSADVPAKRPRGRPKGSKNRRISIADSVGNSSPSIGGKKTSRIVIRKEKLSLQSLFSDLFGQQPYTHPVTDTPAAYGLWPPPAPPQGLSSDGRPTFYGAAGEVRSLTADIVDHTTWNSSPPAPYMDSMAFQHYTSFQPYMMPTQAPPVFSKISPFERCVLCRESGLDTSTAFVCSRRSCHRLFCLKCVNMTRSHEGGVFNENLNECIVCVYQSRKRATSDPNQWHFDFRDESDTQFVRVLRDMLPMGSGLFIEISRSRQPCWRRKLSSGSRKHFSFRFYGGILESRLEALEINSDDLRTRRNSRDRRRSTRLSSFDYSEASPVDPLGEVADGIPFSPAGDWDVCAHSGKLVGLGVEPQDEAHIDGDWSSGSLDFSFINDEDDLRVRADVTHDASYLDTYATHTMSSPNPSDAWIQKSTTTTPLQPSIHRVSFSLELIGEPVSAAPPVPLNALHSGVMVPGGFPGSFEYDPHAAVNWYSMQMQQNPMNASGDMSGNLGMIEHQHQWC